MPRLSESDQHRICSPTLLALWLAARSLEIKQGSKESPKFEEIAEEKPEGVGN